LTRGTKIAAQSGTPKTHHHSAKDHPDAGTRRPDAVIERIGGLARELAEMVGLEVAQISGVGVGVPATIDLEEGIIWLIPNLPGDWRGKPIVAILRRLLGCPVYLINDARAFTLAEATIGAGKGSASCAGITLGTGIGGGIAINGRLYHHGSQRRPGHHTIDLYGTPDGTGNPGRLGSDGERLAIAAPGHEGRRRASRPKSANWSTSI
jgi:glucokinase